MKIFKINVFTSLKYYFIVSKCFGIFPFKVKNEERIIAKLDPIWVFHSFCVILTNTLTMILTFCVGMRGEFVQEVWRIIGVFGVLLNLVQFCIQLIRQKLLLKLIQKFKKLDEKALKSGIFMNSDQDQRKIMLMTTIPIIIIFIYCLYLFIPIYDRNDRVEIYMHINFALSHLFSYYYSIQFWVFTWLLRIRFNKLKMFLKASFMIKRIGWKLDKIQHFSELFSMSCSIMELINLIYSTNMIFTFLYLIIHEIFTSYALVSSLYHKIGKYNITVNTTWIITIVFLKVLICYGGESTTNAAEANEKLVIKEMTQSQDEIFKKELQILHYQLRNTKKSIENCFFTINFKLVLMVSMRLRQGSFKFNKLIFPFNR